MTFTMPRWQATQLLVAAAVAVILLLRQRDHATADFAGGATVTSTQVVQPPSTSALPLKLHRRLSAAVDEMVSTKRPRRSALVRAVIATKLQTGSMVIPPGEGRILLLQSPPSAKFKVTLSASPLERSTAGDPVQDYERLSSWGVEPRCNGYGLIAAAIRRDLVPSNLTRLTSPVVRFERRRPPRKEVQDLLELLGYGCDEQALLAAQQQQEQQQQQQKRSSITRRELRRGNTAYLMPVAATDLLLKANTSSTKRTPGEKELEGFWQLRGWPPQQAPLPDPAGANDSCLRQFEQLNNTPSLNVTLPGQTGDIRTECGNQNESNIMVFAYNCFIHPDTTMLVRVNVDVVKQVRNICARGGLWAVQVMCGLALGFMAIFAAASLLPEGCLAAVTASKRLYKHAASKRRQGPVPVAESGSDGPSTAEQQDAQQSSQGNTVTGGGSGCEAAQTQLRPAGSSGSFTAALQGFYCWYHEVLSSLNSPSGYNRWYTVTVTTSAALLVAAIVWAPDISPTAVHDNAFQDVAIIPRKSYGAGKPWWDNMTYYLKVMGLSALFGHTVKLALLSNLSPPGPESRGLAVPLHVWKGQVVMSVFGLLMLAFILSSYFASLIALQHALEVLEAHWYLIGVMGLNYVAAVVLYVRYTFIHPPPLTSEAAQLATVQPAGRSHLPRSWTSRTSRTPSAQPAHQMSDAKQEPDQDHGCTAKGEEAPRRRAAMQCLGSVAAQLKDAVLEDENFRYSAWVLTPVWLTMQLVVFWWLLGACRTGVVLHCLQDPAACSGGVLPFTRNITSLQLQVQDLANSGEEVRRKASDTLAAANATLLDIKSTLQRLDGSINVDTLIKRLNQVDALLTARVQEAQKLEASMDKAENAAKHALDTAEKAGRWLGYTTAMLLAFVSLFNIVQTFKRVLLYRAYTKKSSGEKEAMLERLAGKSNTGARMLARAIVGISHSADADHPECTLEPVMEPSPFEVAAANTGVRQRFAASNRRPSVKDSHAAGMSVVGRGGSATGMNRGTVTFAATSCALRPTGSSAIRGLSSGSSHQEDSLCVTIAQDIQRLEMDMARFGIGASTALFGVMASVMWIQIRIIGLALTFAYTLVFHPAVLRVTWEKGYWIPVATAIVIVLFNMLFIKRVVGSRWLSDGTYIKHRGSWMTYYLMFQFCYMVLGTLYAVWRVVLAVMVMLLFSVAALDRSLLLAFKMVDGPYIAFVTSVKLEEAYAAISRRDAEAEALADSQQQEAAYVMEQRHMEQDKPDDAAGLRNGHSRDIAAQPSSGPPAATWSTAGSYVAHNIVSDHQHDVR